MLNNQSSCERAIDFYIAQLWSQIKMTPPAWHWYFFLKIPSSRPAEDIIQLFSGAQHYVLREVDRTSCVKSISLQVSWRSIHFYFYLFYLFF